MLKQEFTFVYLHASAKIEVIEPSRSVVLLKRRGVLKTTLAAVHKIQPKKTLTVHDFSEIKLKSGNQFVRDFRNCRVRFWSILYLLILLRKSDELQNRNQF